jgi:hypothetical protein
MRHIADDRLSALVHRDVLDPDGLITSAPVSLERLHLRRKRPAELLAVLFLLADLDARPPRHRLADVGKGDRLQFPLGLCFTSAWNEHKQIFRRERHRSLSYRRLIRFLSG